MIYDNIENYDTYKSLNIIHPVLLYLSTLNIDSLPEETIKILDGAASLAVKYPKIRPIEECNLFEAHRRFVDIHYTITGIEGIAVRNVSELTMYDAFNVEKDIGFYQGTQHALCYIHSGEFLVCFPQDAHKVGILAGDTSFVKKIIVKIPVEAFG